MLVSVPVEHDFRVLLKPVGVSVVQRLGVVDVIGVWDVTLLSGQTEGTAGANTVVVEHVEVGEESGGGLGDSDLEVSEGDEFGVDEMVTLRVPGVPLHDIELGVLISERDSGDHVGSEINAENEDGREGKGQLAHNEEQEGGDLGDVGGESVGNGFLQVIEDESTFLNTVDDGREVIVKEDHISSVLGDFGSATHSNTDIGLLNCGGIVDTITGDGDDVTESLASIDDEEFLGRSGSGEHNFVNSDPVHDLAAFLDFLIIESFFLEVNGGELVTVDDDSLALSHGLLLGHTSGDHVVELQGLVLDNVNLGSDGGTSVLLITGDHDDLDTGGTALKDRHVNTLSGRIVEGNETDEVQVPHGEPAGEEVVLVEHIPPCSPAFGIEHHVLVEVLHGELDLGETKNTFSHVSEKLIGIKDFLLDVFSEIARNASNEDGVASLENSVRSSLEEDAKVVLNTLGLLHGRIHISDKKVELDVGGEVDLVKLVGGGGVSVDGVLITVLSNTTGGPASLVVNVLSEEGFDEFDETGLGGITFDTLVDEVTI